MNKKNEKPGEIIFGGHPILEVLRAKKRKVYRFYTTKPEPKIWVQIRKLLPKRPIPIQYISRDALSKLAGSKEHQGIVALVQQFIYVKNFFDPKKNPYIILLDSIQNVGNVGAIIRSAYCANCDGVVICSRSGAPLTASAIKASAGLAEHIPICQSSSVQQAVQLAKKAGYTLYLATLNGKDARTVEYEKPLCLVIGNEATGISKSILKEGVPITLAQKESNISYNASVAAGILLFTIATNLKKL